VFENKPDQNAQAHLNFLKLITYVHLEKGHAGTDKCIRTINSMFYIKNLGRKTRKLLSLCEICQIVKFPNWKYDIETRPPEGESQPLTLVQKERQAFLRLKERAEKRERRKKEGLPKWDPGIGEGVLVETCRLSDASRGVTLNSHALMMNPITSVDSYPPPSLKYQMRKEK
jgi:hypothetical protein